MKRWKRVFLGAIIKCTAVTAMQMVFWGTFFIGVWFLCRALLGGS